MKKGLLFALFFVAVINLFSQASESKSGIQQFNISKKGTELKRYSDESRAPSDVIPPVITLLSPEYNADSVVTTSSKLLTVRGKVTDEGGIFEVVVNGVEAKVAADGTFLAEVPLAFGRNHIKVFATDISLNSSTLEFYS